MQCYIKDKSFKARLCQLPVMSFKLRKPIAYVKKKIGGLTKTKYILNYMFIFSNRKFLCCV